jgi:hypothetical protein
MIPNDNNKAIGADGQNHTASGGCIRGASICLLSATPLRYAFT